MMRALGSSLEARLSLQSPFWKALARIAAVSAVCLLPAFSADSATLHLNPEIDRAIASRPASPGLAAQQLKGFDWKLATSKAVPLTVGRVSGLLIDAAQNADSATIGSGNKAIPAYGSNAGHGRVSAVLIATQRGSTQIMAEAVKRLGGRVRGIVGSRLYVDVPSKSVEKLDAVAGLRAAWPDWRMEAVDESDAHVENGVAAVHVDDLHRAGLRGKGVKVGILDLGFHRYSELRARNIVPAARASQRFGDSEDIESGTDHGTACAEIVHAMAPEAALYIAAFDGSTASAIEGAKWLADQGVTIISASFGGHFAPNNGTNPQDIFVDQLVTERGITWINASGNEGESHWRGEAIDTNDQGLVDIPGHSAPIDLLTLDFKRQGPWRVYMTWDDWPDAESTGEREDLDLFIIAIDSNTGKPVVVAQSTEPQDGTQPPVEMVVDGQGQVPAGTRLYVAIKATHLTKAAAVHVFVDGAVQISPSESTGSVGSPATAHKALAVGAFDIISQSLADYSSRGPTDDGRLKPEIIAPTNTTSAIYEPTFQGTSASAPHASGFAALLQQAHPELRGDALRQEILRKVQPVGQTVPNNETGYGLIDGRRIVASGASAAPQPVPGTATPPSKLEQTIDDLLKQQQSQPPKP
jgi:subtilisin family serine protease